MSLNPTFSSSKSSGPHEYYCCALCHARLATSSQEIGWCSGCHTVAYCGTECQKLHWKDHKKNCRKKKGKNSSSVEGPNVDGVAAAVAGGGTQFYLEESMLLLSHQLTKYVSTFLPKRHDDRPNEGQPQATSLNSGSNSSAILEAVEDYFDALQDDAFYKMIAAALTICVLSEEDIRNSLGVGETQQRELMVMLNEEFQARSQILQARFCFYEQQQENDLDMLGTSTSTLIPVASIPTENQRSQTELVHQESESRAAIGKVVEKVMMHLFSEFGVQLGTLRRDIIGWYHGQSKPADYWYVLPGRYRHWAPMTTQTQVVFAYLYLSNGYSQPLWVVNDPFSRTNCLKRAPQLLFSSLELHREKKRGKEKHQVPAVSPDLGVLLTIFLLSSRARDLAAVASEAEDTLFCQSLATILSYPINPFAKVESLSILPSLCPRACIRAANILLEEISVQNSESDHHYLRERFSRSIPSATRASIDMSLCSGVIEVLLHSGVKQSIPDTGDVLFRWNNFFVPPTPFPPPLPADSHGATLSYWKDPVLERRSSFTEDAREWCEYFRKVFKPRGNIFTRTAGQSHLIGGVDLQYQPDEFIFEAMALLDPSSIVKIWDWLIHINGDYSLREGTFHVYCLYAALTSDYSAIKELFRRMRPEHLPHCSADTPKGWKSITSFVCRILDKVTSGKPELQQRAKRMYRAILREGVPPEGVFKNQ